MNCKHGQLWRTWQVINKHFKVLSQLLQWKSTFNWDIFPIHTYIQSSSTKLPSHYTCTLNSLSKSPNKAFTRTLCVGSQYLSQLLCLIYSNVTLNVQSHHKFSIHCEIYFRTIRIHNTVRIWQTTESLRDWRIYRNIVSDFGVGLLTNLTKTDGSREVTTACP